MASKAGARFSTTSETRSPLAQPLAPHRALMVSLVFFTASSYFFSLPTASPGSSTASKPQFSIAASFSGKSLPGMTQSWLESLRTAVGIGWVLGFILRSLAMAGPARIAAPAARRLLRNPRLVMLMEVPLA